MRLKQALDLAIDCGLSTIGEAVLNVDMHSLSIFSYRDMEYQLNELYEEYEKVCADRNYTADTAIATILKEVSFSE